MGESKSTNIIGMNISGVNIKGCEYKWYEPKVWERNCDVNVNVVNISDGNG